MKSQLEKFDDDDGRVICSMDVEGMRWHDKKMRRRENAILKVPQGEQLTRSEARRFNWYSVLAGLLVVSVFSLAWVLFTLFCTQVWFR